MKNKLKPGRKCKPLDEIMVPIGISEYIKKSDKDKIIESEGKFLALKQDLKIRLRKGLENILNG